MSKVDRSLVSWSQKIMLYSRAVCPRLASLVAANLSFLPILLHIRLKYTTETYSLLESYTYFTCIFTMSLANELEDAQEMSIILNADTKDTFTVIIRGHPYI